jgi:hypothetical protein
LQKYIKTTVPRVYDAFDVLWDTHYLFEENAAITKLIRTTPKRIAESKLYKDFTGAKVAAGNVDYKELYYMDKLGSSAYRDNERVVLYEIKMKKEIDGMPCVVLKTIDGNGKVLRTETENNMPFYDMVPFQPFSGNPYQPSLAQLQLPINRQMDLMTNRIDSMGMKYVKGSFLMPMNTEVTMTDQDGTLLKYTGPVAPTPLEQPAVPTWAFTWLNLLMGFSDRYGRNTITMGGAPKGSNMRSGKMMDKVTQGQQAQDKTPLDNLMWTMKQVAQVVLYRESMLMDEPRQFTLNDPSNPKGITQTKMVGEDWYPLYKQDSSVVPLPKTVGKMTVSIEDESTQGIDAKRKSIVDLVEIYPKTPPELQTILLNAFKVGDTADIMQQAGMKKSLLDSPEFKAIIDNMRAGMYNNDPQFLTALKTIFQKLSGSAPTTSVNDQAVKPKDGSIPPPGGQPAQGGQPPAAGGQPDPGGQPAQGGQPPAAGGQPDPGGQPAQPPAK